MCNLARSLASVRWTLDSRPRQNLSPPDGSTYPSTVTDGRLEGTLKISPTLGREGDRRRKEGAKEMEGDGRRKGEMEGEREGGREGDGRRKGEMGEREGGREKGRKGGR